MSALALLLLVAVAAPGEQSLLAELERMDRTLGAAESRLGDTTMRERQTRDELAALEAELAGVTVRRQEAFARFKKRVRALARMPAGARVALLGGSRSLGEYLDTTRVLRWVAMHDRKLHDQFAATAERVDRLRAQLEAHRRELAATQAAQREQRDALATRREERFALLRSIVEQRELAARAAKERSAAGRALSETVRKLSPSGPQSRSFAKNRGRLPWPATGELTRGYGQVVELSSGTATTHNGLELRAPAGATVQAVANGRVVFADWLRGYGQVVIVDHGDKFHTLAAHLASIKVAVGDEVPAGAPVGTVGDTGSIDGTKLYFEVRHQGLPLDPAEWLRQ